MSVKVKKVMGVREPGFKRSKCVKTKKDMGSKRA